MLRRSERALRHVLPPLILGGAVIGCSNGTNSVTNWRSAHESPEVEESTAEALVANADIPLQGGNEPTIAVNPTNTNNVVVAEFRSLRISTDGGVTFPMTVNANLPANFGGFGGDSSMAFDSQGRLLWAMFASPTGSTNSDVFVQQVNAITGTTVGTAVDVTEAIGLPSPANSHDKEWIAVDRFAGSPVKDRIYVVWTDFTSGTTVRTTSSNHHSATWTNPVNLSAPSEGFVRRIHIAVAPNSTAYAGYHATATGQIFIARSTDGGATFGLKSNPFGTNSANITFNVKDSGDALLDRVFSWTQGAGQPWLLPDPTDTTGNKVAVVWADDPTDS